MAHLTRPLALALALALALMIAAIAALAGCGGGDAGEDLTEGLEARELLDASGRAWNELESVRLAFEIAGTADLGPEAERLLGDMVDLAGEGVVRPPDAAAIDATVRIAGLPIQAGLTRRADQVVLSVLGRDVAIDLDRETLDFLDFSAAYPELIGWVSGPERTEGERIDGSDTVAVSGALAPQRALAALRPLLGAEAPSGGEVAGFAGTATIWVGVNDLIPRRVALSLRGDAGDLAPEAGPLDISATADLTRINSAGEVVVPPATTRLRPEELGSLIGG